MTDGRRRINRLMHSRKWDLICSYGSILAVGLGFYLIPMIVYIMPGKGDILMGIRSFPGIFLTWTLPLLILQTITLLIADLVLIIREGIRLKRLLGVAFGIACILMNLLCRYTVFTSTLACYAECIIFGISVMSMAAALYKPGLNNEYVIILGCAIGKDGLLLPLLRERVNRAIRFAWEQEIATGKPVRFIPSGGQGDDEIMSEGSAMTMYLVSHSAEDYEVLSERKSRNTYENFLYSREIIEEHSPGAQVTFITTNFHVLRSGMLARKAGLNAEGLASRAKWYFWPNGFVREIIAIVVLYKKAQIAAAAVCAMLTLLLTVSVR